VVAARWHYSRFSSTVSAQQASVATKSGSITLEPIACIEFTACVMRPVFEDGRGQFVLDDDGNRVDGLWYIPREECPQLAPEPVIVTA
jgi:hypothetical protein